MFDASVCVIIPVYKDSQYLNDAIKSIKSQTFNVNEIIVVNDCSPETKEIERIIQNYPEVKYIKNSSNVGLAASRNIGAFASNCEIISFLDADDMLHPQSIEARLSILQPNSAVTIDNLRFYSFPSLDATKSIYKTFSSTKTTNIFKIYSFPNLTGAGLMMYKNDFLKIRGYNETLKSCEDLDLWWRLYECGYSIQKITNKFYFYRYNIYGLSNQLSWISLWEKEAVSLVYKRYHWIYYPCIFVLTFIWHLKRLRRFLIYP